MRRRGEGGAEEAKVVIQKDSKQSKKKKIIALRFPRSFHTTYGLDDHLSPPVCLRKKKILSLSLLFCRPPPHCVKANNNTKRRDEKKR